MASFASIGAVFHTKNDILPSSLVGFRGSDIRSRREDIRAVVHEREAYSVDGGKPGEPAFGGRKLRRSSCSGSDGVEGECYGDVCVRDDTLSCGFRDALSENVGKQLPSGDAPAGYVLVHCSSEHGELSLGLHLRDV